MKIGIDARPLSYQLTGIGIYLKSILDALQQIDLKNHYFLISNASIDWVPKNPKWVKLEGRIKRKLCSTPWMQTWGALLGARLKIDLFWSPRHHLPLLLPSHIKTVLTVHDIVHHYYPDTMAWPNLLVERLLMRWSISRSDYIITDSRSVASELFSAYKLNDKKIVTIYPGIPSFKEESRKTKGEQIQLPASYFLFVGTLEPRKNFNAILKAFEEISPNRYGVNLVIAGQKGWKTNRFARILNQHPQRPNIHFLGYVAREKLKRIYENAVCLLFPSLYEGFGFPILEAMKCGTPVITSNTSCMPEVADGAAVLVDPHDHRALAKAMMDIIENGNLKNQLKIKGLQRAREFSWFKCARKTIHLFESVVSS